jgi:Big-like domain-containing protein
MHYISKLCAVLAVLLAAGGCSDNTAPSTVDTTPPATTAVSPAATVLLVGQTQVYTLTLIASTNVVTWTSSNENVLTIDASGTATGRANGVSTITGASDGGTSATLVVQVVPVYAGSWAGTSTVLACTNLVGFEAAGYCAQSQATERWTLTLTQSGLTVNGAMTKSEGANVLNGNVNGTIGGGGEIIALTGTLGGFARGANLVLTPISWNTIATGSGITGTWAANVTSPQILGIATLQWRLTGTLQ